MVECRESLGRIRSEWVLGSTAGWEREERHGIIPYQALWTAGETLSEAEGAAWAEALRLQASRNCQEDNVLGMSLLLRDVGSI